MRRPELVGIGKIAVFLEQIGNDLAAERAQIEQGSADRYRRAAEQPRLQLLPARRIAVGIVEQRQPSLLLCLGRQGQMPDRGRVDFFGATGFADARQKIAEREDAFDLQFGKRKGRGYVLDAAALLDQLCIAFPLGHSIGVLAQHILDHRDFQCFGIVAFTERYARQAYIILALLGGFEAGIITPFACNDLEMARFTSLGVARGRIGADK